jgi:hypothetical protein
MKYFDFLHNQLEEKIFAILMSSDFEDLALRCLQVIHFLIILISSYQKSFKLFVK